jgi:hypothetical protein
VFRLDAGELYAFNNTIYNCDVGFWDNGLDPMFLLINNIFQNGVAGYYRQDTGSDYNISDLEDDANGAHSKNGVTVSFVSTATGTEDFHLSPTDTAARGAGTAAFPSPFQGLGASAFPSPFKACYRKPVKMVNWIIYLHLYNSC